MAPPMPMVDDMRWWTTESSAKQTLVLDGNVWPAAMISVRIFAKLSPLVPLVCVRRHAASDRTTVSYDRRVLSRQLLVLHTKQPCVGMDCVYHGFRSAIVLLPETLGTACLSTSSIDRSPSPGEGRHLVCGGDPLITVPRYAECYLIRNWVR